MEQNQKKLVEIDKKIDLFEKEEGDIVRNLEVFEKQTKERLNIFETK